MALVLASDLRPAAWRSFPVQFGSPSIRLSNPLKVWCCVAYSRPIAPTYLRSRHTDDCVGADQYLLILTAGTLTLGRCRRLDHDDRPGG